LSAVSNEGEHKLTPIGGLKDHRHGIVKGYRNLRCRCDRCRAARLDCLCVVAPRLPEQLKRSVREVGKHRTAHIPAGLEIVEHRLQFRQLRPARDVAPHPPRGCQRDQLAHVLHGADR
jgi:hypothetical protein